LNKQREFLWNCKPLIPVGSKGNKSLTGPGSIFIERQTTLMTNRKKMAYLFQIIEEDRDNPIVKTSGQFNLRGFYSG
jgi:hypothetical protein